MTNNEFGTQFLSILVLRAPLNCSARAPTIRWVVVEVDRCCATYVDEVDGCEYDTYQLCSTLGHLVTKPIRSRSAPIKA